MKSTLILWRKCRNLDSDQYRKSETAFCNFPLDITDANDIWIKASISCTFALSERFSKWIRTFEELIIFSKTSQLN